MALIILAGSLTAQSNFIVQNASMTIEGTSTLHDWTSNVTEVYMNGEVEMQAGQLQKLENFKVRIPVKSIVSEKGSMMDNKTYDALKSDKHPNITYQLTQLQEIQKNGQKYTLETIGSLTIAGTTKSIRMKVTGQQLSNERILFEGQKKLNMKDFNVSPPTAMLGTIKAGEEVTVKFSVTIKEKPNADWSISQ